MDGRRRTGAASGNELNRVRASWDALAGDYDKRHGDEGNDWHRLVIEPATLALLGDVRASAFWTRRVLPQGPLVAATAHPSFNHPLHELYLPHKSSRPRARIATLIAGDG